MTLDDVGSAAAALAGVRRRRLNGLDEWRYHGRLVARQLDERRLVVRSELAARAALVRRHPTTFDVPREFLSHMMVVCDLVDGDRDAIEDVLHAAWELQRRRR